MIGFIALSFSILTLVILSIAITIAFTSTMHEWYNEYKFKKLNSEYDKEYLKRLTQYKKIETQYNQYLIENTNNDIATNNLNFLIEYIKNFYKNNKMFKIIKTQKTMQIPLKEYYEK